MSDRMQAEAVETASTGARLARLAPQVMERWEARVRAEAPAAARLDRPALWNTLPVLLDRLSRLLSESGAPDVGGVAQMSQEHGRQRAGIRGYSVDQVIHELALLRKAVCETLETEAPLPPPDRERITEALEAAMREAAAWFAAAARDDREHDRLLVENARDFGIFMMDLDGRVASWNPGAERILGYRSEEIVGRSGALIFTPEDRAAGAPEQELGTAAREGRADDERWHVRKDGSCFRASGVTMALYDAAGGLRGFGKVMRDVTAHYLAEIERAQLLDRERAARAEAERERDFVRLVLDHAPLAIGVMEGPDHVFRLVNPRTVELVGLPAEALLGRPHGEVLPDAHAVVGPILDRVYRTGEPETAPDVEVTLPRGGTRSLYVSWAPLRGADGKPQAVMYLSLDTTERKHADQALRESEERLKMALQSARLGSWELDLRTHALLASPTCKANFGLQPEAEFSYESLFEAIHPDDRERTQAAVQQSLAERRDYTADYRVLWPNGSLHWISAHGRPVYGADGRPVRMIGVTLDVTERKQAEEALRVSRERLDLVLRSIELGLWYCDLPFDRLIWNDRCKEHFGLSPDTEVDIDLFYQCIHPDDRERTRKAIDRSITAHEHYDIEYRTVAADGRLRWIRAIGSGFYDAGGQPTRFDGITVDITDQKRTQEALLDADRRKDEFLAMLAHELRNPLAPIVNAVHVLRVQGPDERTLERQREVIGRQARQMARLLDDLLDVSRITQGKIELRKQRLDLRTVVEQALEGSRPLLEARGQELSVALSTAPVEVEADAARLHQVIGNLLTNASKYTEHQGSVSVALAEEGGQAVLRVRDTGVGMAPELLPRVFDLFTQGDRTLARSEGGLGIGLTMVKRLVEMHGGGVEARSEGLGRGSEFILRLPLARETRSPAVYPEAPGPSANPETLPAKPKTVLVVDDNQDAVETLAELLELWGYGVRIAPDGLRALQEARAARPDVVLLDIGMPGMDGYEVARRLRSAERGGDRRSSGETDNGKLVLIALTGYGQEEDLRRSREAGCDYHLTKPVDPDRLRDLLDR